MRLRGEYIRANCCSPGVGDSIVGYYSHNNLIKVHREDCSNLKKAEAARLVSLVWEDILAAEKFRPDNDYRELDNTDFSILEHHQVYGFDYSNKVAAMLNLDRRSVFDRHAKLKEMKLIERVEPRMIQYRKNIVKGKWIKHRNHTYYDLTQKGKDYLEYYRQQGPGPPRNI